MMIQWKYSVYGRLEMIKRLTKHGNSLALVIDKGILGLLRIDAKTPLSITTDGESLVISPARNTAR